MNEVKFKDEVKIMVLKDIENGPRKREVLKARERWLVGYQILEGDHLGQYVAFSDAAQVV